MLFLAAFICGWRKLGRYAWGRRSEKPTKFGWEARRFPHKNRRDEPGARTHTWTEVDVQTGAAVSFQSIIQQDRVPPVPTTSQLVATDYSDCCLKFCLHGTKRTVVVVNTEREEHACCLGCCQTDDSRTCIEKTAIEPKIHTSYTFFSCMRQTMN